MDYKRLTFKYGLVQGAYWMAYCTIHAYAAVFLIDHGFGNGQIGVMLALANILAVILQPIVGAKLDVAKKITVRDVLLLASAAMMIISALLLVLRENAVLSGILFLICYMFQMICQPLTTTLSYEFINRGHQMNFGLARGCGSILFAVVSTMIGAVIQSTGIIVLPITSILLFLIYFLSIYALKLPAETVAKENLSDKADAHTGFLAFVKHYQKFTWFLGAVVLVFFTHNLINDFMIRVITPIGGNSSSMGYALALAAVFELPAMALFDKLKNRINCGTLLKCSLFFFTVKSCVSFIAWNMAVYYFAMSLQAVAYALFIPAAVYYVNQKMEPLDLVKGQAYVTGGITLGGVFGTILGGFLLDHISVGSTLLIATVVSAVGSLIAFIFVEKVVDIR